MRASLDVFLMPAVVGGGWGDIDEVLVAGAHLCRAGFPLTLYRRRGRPLPRAVDGPWDWPRHRRTDRLEPRAPRALTLTPCWGVSAAPTRDEPFGRGGPWEVEAAEIERRYGAESTLHVSLEEFARTATSAAETVERWREGGIPQREIRRRAGLPSFRREAAIFHAAYRRFRAFDRPNVLHLYATFAPSRPFAREYPEAVQCGPLWPVQRSLRARPRRSNEWVWYASPSSAERIAPSVAKGLADAPGGPRLAIRSPRPWKFALPPEVGALRTDPVAPAAWRREFDSAAVRIVTGSRSLLEALQHGGPFLYFNGILGNGAATHRHRPEKIDRLLAVHAFSPEVRRDLAEFARGRRVEDVVRRTARRAASRGRRDLGPWVHGFPSPYEDAGRLIVEIARRFAAREELSTELVTEARARRIGRST